MCKIFKPASFFYGKISQNKKILENFGYLSVLQLFTLLIPLLTYPYLVRVLGVDLWGKVILAQVVISYFVLIINFGFDISATKDVAVNIDNKIKLQEVFSSVMIVKTFLFLLSMCVFLILMCFVPFMKKESVLYFFSFLLCVGEWLFPVWYYQGVEKMKYITIINISSKVLFFSLIFVFIKGKSDYIYIPLLNGIGGFIGGVIGLWVVVVKHGISIKFQPMSVLMKTLNESAVLFVNRAIISIKDRFSILFVGGSLGTAEVALFDLGLKLMGLFSILISIVCQTVYPKYSRELDKDFIKAVIRNLFIVVILFLCVLHVFMSDIIFLLGGEDMLKGIGAVHVLLVSPIFFSIGNCLGPVVMSAHHMYKQLFLGVVMTTVFYISLMLSFYFFNLLSRLDVLCFIVVSTYIFECAYRLVFCVRKELI